MAEFIPEDDRIEYIEIATTPEELVDVRGQALRLFHAARNQEPFGSWKVKQRRYPYEHIVGFESLFEGVVFDIGHDPDSGNVSLSHIQDEHFKAVSFQEVQKSVLSPTTAKSFAVSNEVWKPKHVLSPLGKLHGPFLNVQPTRPYTIANWQRNLSLLAEQRGRPSVRPRWDIILRNLLGF